MAIRASIGAEAPPLSLAENEALRKRVATRRMAAALREGQIRDRTPTESCRETDGETNGDTARGERQLVVASSFFEVSLGARFADFLVQRGFLEGVLRHNFFNFVTD